MLVSRVLRVVTWAGVWMLTSCAVGTPAGVVCSSDADCPAGQDCDLEALICVRAVISPTNNNPNGRVEPNSTANNSADMGNNNASDIDVNNTNNPPDNNSTSNNSNNSTTPANNHAMCEPACEAPGTCVAGSCVYPECAALGDPCNPATSSQGDFTCIDVGGEGVCVPPCSRAGSADVCATGEYCVTYNDEPVCLPSFCNTNADCMDGTCIDIDNGFNFCKPAGTLASGAPCDPQDDQCPIDEACDPLTDTCEPMCDPFAASPCAELGHYCGVLVSPRTGLCSHSLVSNAPRSPFDSCTQAGDVCDDASRCFRFDATTTACLNYCRPGMNDCSGVLLNLNPTVCDEYFFFEPGTGVCWPPCALDSECGGDFVCVDQRCRLPCTPGNEVADCCGGQTPCPAYCNNMLCE